MSDEARCQAWVRLSLNQQLLGSYLETIEHDRHTRDLATASYTVGAPPVARVATTVATHFLLQRARDRVVHLPRFTYWQPLSSSSPTSPLPVVSGPRDRLPSVLHSASNTNPNPNPNPNPNTQPTGLHHRSSVA